MPARNTPAKPDDPHAPIVLLANWFQFAPGQQVDQAQVQSRAILWCKEGTGTLQINGSVHEVTPGSYFLLPWNRRLIYRADKASPFLLAAVHWVPFYEPAAKVVYDVSHAPNHALTDSPLRRDAAIPGWREPFYAGDLRDAQALFHLCEHIVCRFSRGDRGVDDMRRLALLLETEIAATLANHGRTAASPSLHRVMQFVRNHLTHTLSLDELAEFAGCSRATLVRQFRAELRTSPIAFVASERMARARELLRTTHLPIYQIARQVGLDNPHYFSRVFRAHTRTTPRQFRARASPI